MNGVFVRLGQQVYRYVPHKDVSVNEAAHTQCWPRKII